MQNAFPANASAQARNLRVAKVLGIGLVGICWLAGLLIGLNARNCAAVFPAALCGPSASALLAIALAAAPLLTMAVAGRLFVAAFGLYIVLVPIDSALLVGSYLTITKLVGIVVAASAAWTLVRRREARRVPYAVFGWLLVLGLMALSIVWALDQRAAVQTLTTISFTFALFALIAVLPLARRELDGMIAATIVSGVVAGVVAIVMAGHDTPTIGGGAGRLYLTFGTATADPNGFAAALLLPVAVTFGAAIAQRGWRRIGLFLVLLFPLTAIYLLASRGATLALIAMSIVAIVASKRRVLLGGILAVGVALGALVPNTIVHRFLLEKGQVNGAERLDIWGVAIQSFRQHWLLGSGLSGFPSAYDRAFFTAYQPQFTMWHRAPHSLIISTSTELGIVGIIVMAVALVLQYRTLRGLHPRAPYSWMPVALRAAFVGLLVAACFVDVLRMKYSWLCFTEMVVVARFFYPTRSGLKGKNES